MMSSNPQRYCAIWDNSKVFPQMICSGRVFAEKPTGLVTQVTPLTPDKSFWRGFHLSGKR
jgi:hypothetical protein